MSTTISELGRGLDISLAAFQEGVNNPAATIGDLLILKRTLGLFKNRVLGAYAERVRQEYPRAADVPLEVKNRVGRCFLALTRDLPDAIHARIRAKVVTWLEAEAKRAQA